MRKLLLIAAIAVTSLFAAATPAEAGFCCKKKVCTQEICREYSSKQKKCGCCCKTVTYVTITYRTTYKDCCGNYTCKTWKKTKKCK